MNNCQDCQKKLVYGVSVLGVFLIMAAMVALMRHYTAPEAPNAARVEERKKNLAEVNGANAQILNNYDWQDKGKGFVRLRMDRAMELVVQEWQKPAEARTRLSERVDKLMAPPPKAPEKKSDFE